jgi:hypothetical protein
VIDAEDFVAFKKLVPQSVASFYQQLVSSKKGTGVNEGANDQEAVNFLNEYGDEKTTEEIDKEIKEIKNNKS